MEELNNEVMSTATAVADVAVEAAPSFVQKHGKDIAELGIGAAIGAGVTIGVTKLVGFIKKKVAARKAKKAEVVAEVTEEALPEETQE